MTSTKPTAEAFLATVKKSGLVEPERLQKVLAAFQAAGGDMANSIAVAEFLVAQNAISKWQAEKLLQGKHKGYFLGKYRLLSLLGKGGMSSVFLAEHILMRRRCAIKVLPTKRVADSSYLARFHREAQAVAALDHPNIVRAYDVDHQTDRDAEIHFLVMEYVEGSSLQELVTNQGPCSFEDAADFIRQAALGLEHAHRAGMVHRDIKPGNLLVDIHGTVKLLDLGLARYFSSEGDGMALTIAHDEKVLGTADYLAPEQALDSHSVDLRADIYSLGCTLYFLLTGHPPFTEGTLAQRLMAHQTREPPPVEQDRPETPASLSALLLKMMAKKPEDRPASARNVADAMLDWLVAHAGAAWKQAHPQLFGGLRSSETHRGLQTTAIPIAKPVRLTMTATTETADTEIVTRAAWPTGDLAAESAPPETEPQLSAFLAQVQPTSPTENSPAKPTRSSVAPPKTKHDTKPPSSPEFEFAAPAGPGGGKGASPPAKPLPPKSSPGKSTVAAKSKSSSSKLAAAPKSLPGGAPVNPADEAAFPSFDFSQPSTTPAEGTPLLRPEDKTSPAAHGSPADRPIAVFIAAAVVGLALIGGTVAWLQGMFSPETWSSPTPIGTVKPKTEGSIRVYGSDADFQSLTEAVHFAQQTFRPRPGAKSDQFVIEIAPGTYNEQVEIDGRKSETTWPTGIVIRGDGQVVFRSEQDGPVFSLQEVNGLTIENITIDAANRPAAMTVSGFVNDTKLSKLTIRNFTEAGLVLSGVLPFGKPLQVDQVRCESASKSAVGMQIAPSLREGRSEDSSNIAVIRSQFIGPLAAGIAVQGNTPHDVAVRESIFSQCQAGIRFEGAGGWRKIEITNDTFFECGVGIDFTAMPVSSASGMVVHRNLFAKTTSLEVRVQTGYQDGGFRPIFAAGGLDWNWSDRVDALAPATPEGHVLSGNGKRSMNFNFESTSPKSPKFLSPSASSPQRSVPNPPTNERDWIGAVGP